MSTFISREHVLVVVLTTGIKSELSSCVQDQLPRLPFVFPHPSSNLLEMHLKIILLTLALPSSVWAVSLPTLWLEIETYWAPIFTTCPPHPTCIFLAWMCTLLTTKGIYWVYHSTVHCWMHCQHHCPLELVSVTCMNECNHPALTEFGFDATFTQHLEDQLARWLPGMVAAQRQKL